MANSAIFLFAVVYVEDDIRDMLYGASERMEVYGRI